MKNPVWLKQGIPHVFFINIRGGSFKKKKKILFLCLNGIYEMQKVRGRVRGRVMAMVGVMVMGKKKKKIFFRFNGIVE
jgi:hypothetical protein